MTLIEVIDNARALVNEPLSACRTFPDDTSSFWTDTQLTSYFNIVQSDVENELIQTFEDYFVTQTFLTISAGISEYDLPSGMIKLRRVEDTRGNGRTQEIRPVTINHAEEDYFTLESASFRGGSYYIRGNQIVLTSTPTFTDNSAIRLHYERKLTDLAIATATSELPPEHHQVLIWGIVRLCLFQQQSDTTLADNEYFRRINNMKKQAENRQVQRPRLVKTVYGDVD